MRVSSDAVLDFSHHLQESADQLGNQRLVILSEFGMLANIWKDERFVPFERSFLGCMEDIEAYLTESRHYAEVLHEYGIRLREIEDDDDY